MMFASGDLKLWMIMKREVTFEESYENELRTVMRYSLNGIEHMVVMFDKKGNKEVPWINLRDHEKAIKNGTILYGENKYGAEYA
jgi:hypothetical protein